MLIEYFAENRKEEIVAEVELKTGQKHRWIDIGAKNVWGDEKEYEKTFQTTRIEPLFPPFGVIYNPRTKKMLQEDIQ